MHDQLFPCRILHGEEGLHPPEGIVLLVPHRDHNG